LKGQIEASRLIQKADFRRWEAETHGPFPAVSDLATKVRPQLDELSRRLLKAVAEAQPYFADESMPRLLRERGAEILKDDGIGDDARQAALAPFQP
jgi:hypothetical protein